MYFEQTMVLIITTFYITVIQEIGNLNIRKESKQNILKENYTHTNTHVYIIILIY